MGVAKGGIAHLDSDGIITALGDGSTYIFARRGSVAAATVLTVGSPTTYTEYSTSAYGVDAYPDAVTILAAGGERQIVTRLDRSEEHTSELQSLMRISYAVFCLKKKNTSSSTSQTPK